MSEPPFTDDNIVDEGWQDPEAEQDPGPAQVGEGGGQVEDLSG